MGFGSSLKKAVGGAIGSAAGGILGPAGNLIGGIAGANAAGGGGFAGIAAQDPDRARRVLKKDIRQGSQFGRQLVGEGSLGRLGTDPDLQAAIAARRELAQGLTGAETQAMRDQASQRIQAETESARRRLGAAQARSGLRGAIASQQQADVLSQGLEQRRQFETDMILKQRAARESGIAGLERSVGQVREFDLGQASREKFAQLQTGLAFGQLGAAQRGAQIGAQASVAAANAAKPTGGIFGGILGK